MLTPSCSQCVNIPRFQVKVKKPSWDSGSVFQIKRKAVSKNGEFLFSQLTFVFLICDYTLKSKLFVYC